MLALVKDAIAARLTGGVKRYGVANRQLEYISLDELNAMRKDLERRLARAENGGTALAVFDRAR